MDNKNSEYIFVYGTLRRKSEHSMYHLLARYADFVDEGYIFGKLYEINNYPGAKISNSTNYKVYGEVYKLKEPIYVLSKLDDYEECSNKYPKPHEYNRILVDVFLNNGKNIKAWIYEYNYSTKDLEFIESGDYIDYLNSNFKSHLKH